ncbi:TlpA family protein disulfide reductase [Marinobacter daepoensis]|uniref:TlpA family protein disulfide reductase n=1 Tax=Marinobacter daepoensis TaxID=262077 RepID=A0ABS3BCB0_9GAMM|nr:TlpA disulfide reductase family protein [Marinobacter daepoensis]MBN7768327.1 TlpA family protein disulfide reductase [Marinobacter daepoensis]MBY6080628.1 TlpA family protein disulfide reductase [Marinobacter daepoensis]
MLSISLGPLSLSIGHLLLVLAFILALVVGGLLGRRYRVPVAGSVADVFVVTMLCARLGFVVGYFEHYQDNLLGIIDIRDGGFDVVWGLVGALAFTLFLLWRRVPVRKPLAIAVVAGAVFWAGTAGTISLIEQQSRGMPDVVLRSLAGEAIPLYSLAQGTPTVVNLWATWCPPCIREMPVLEAAQAEHPNIRFVFANQREQPETIQSFIEAQQLSLDNLYLDGQGRIAGAVGSQGLPTTLFYNAEGQLVDTHFGELSKATLARGLEKIHTP